PCARSPGSVATPGTRQQPRAAKEGPMGAKPVPKVERKGFNRRVYDSELVQKGPANAELRITLKIRFIPVKASENGGVIRDGAKQEFHTRDWDPQELKTFKST